MYSFFTNFFVVVPIVILQDTFKIINSVPFKNAQEFLIIYRIP